MPAFTKKLTYYGSFFAISLLLTGCKKNNDPAVVTYPDKATATAPVVLLEINGVKVYNGGFGSAIVKDPQSADHFYLLTDRGPNIDGMISDSKIFAKPDFCPQIGKFKLEGTTLTLVQTIEMKNAAGVKINGLPNPDGQGGTGEKAFDTNGNAITPSADGLDPEGMTIAPDGTFWLADEYGPHLLHLDANGKTIERINPFGNGTGGRKIPLVFAKRRANRGMEGLTLTPDGKTLVGIMQSPMYNPSKSAVKDSKVTRILTYDLTTGASKQFVYVLETSNLLNSEIVAVSNTVFLVLERDGEYAGDPSKPAIYKRVYKIDITNATDISDAANGEKGKLYGGKTVDELLDTPALQAAGITPVSKSLLVDILKLSLSYPHDKAEGLAIINSTTIAISNDDDFGVVGLGTVTAKILPSTNTVDQNTIFFIKLSTPLY
ncbi:MAG: esterase-like activity of phytase family protein [Bacteroidota bacterium]